MSAVWPVRAATPADQAVWGTMRQALWPDEDDVADASVMQAWLDDADKTTLLALAPNGDVIGFAELGVRHDYVNGTRASPVGFLEGWYVAPHWRGRGVGKALVMAGEDWTRRRGHTEFASDVLIDNADSLAAHAACGFEETERVVYFRKALNR